MYTDTEMPVDCRSGPHRTGRESDYYDALVGAGALCGLATWRETKEAPVKESRLIAPDLVELLFELSR